MIRIERPADPPSVLVTKGKAHREKVCEAAIKSRDGESKSAKLPFRQDVYAAASVRRALADAQHGKCCYCESKVGTDCDVEHFRPKAAVCQGDGHPLEAPGYYWLAYEWTNLLLACKACNQLYKKNFFPLGDPSRRARAPEDDLAAESPLLIDPAPQDPEHLIGYRDEIPFAIDGNRLGLTTIEVLQLHRREDLNERRRDRLRSLRELHRIVRLAQDDPDNLRLRLAAVRAEEFLVRSEAASAEFAAMARVAASVESHVEN